jgi:hypothetical protein
VGRDAVTYPGIFRGRRGGSTNSVEDKGQRERGSGAVAPQSGVPLNLQSGSNLSNLWDVEGCYGCEFGSALSKLRNFGEGGVEHPFPPPPSVRHCRDGFWNPL